VNDTVFGFDACVFSSDLSRAHRMADELRAGSVAVNDVLVNMARGDLRGGTGRRVLPGRERGDAEGCDPQRSDPSAPSGPGRLLIDDGSNNSEPHWFPYSAARLQALERVLPAPDRPAAATGRTPAGMGAAKRPGASP